jgi:hypothetical protein
MFENKGEGLLSRQQYIRRQARHVVLAGSVIVAGWVTGIAGYMILEGMSFVDAVLNSAMILGGMGPVGELHTTAGKIFASFYAIFSGVGFIGATGVLFAPLYHRFIHKFHLDLEEHKKLRDLRSNSQKRTNSAKNGTHFNS